MINKADNTSTNSATYYHTVIKKMNKSLCYIIAFMRQYRINVQKLIPIRKRCFYHNHFQEEKQPPILLRYALLEACSLVNLEIDQ